ncbi:MAG TPA: hypothetical protein VJB57_10205 [Dehalococcoidia bacterium]|nr:hypothetical protein [Dehalococcoidia bacterium]
MQLGPNFKLGTLLLLVVFFLSAGVLYAGAQLVKEDSTAVSADGEGEDGAVPSGPVSVRIVGKDLKFDKRSFSAGAGAQVTVTFDNQDSGVLHNIAFYTNRSASQKIAGTDVKPGPVIDELRFTAPQPGNAFYRCDVHPDTMTGTMTVR